MQMVMYWRSVRLQLDWSSSVLEVVMRSLTDNSAVFLIALAFNVLQVRPNYVSCHHYGSHLG
jgi:hypothetical protein